MSTATIQTLGIDVCIQPSPIHGDNRDWNVVLLRRHSCCWDTSQSTSPVTQDPHGGWDWMQEGHILIFRIYGREGHT